MFEYPSAAGSFLDEGEHLILICPVCRTGQFFRKIPYIGRKDVWETIFCSCPECGLRFHVFAPTGIDGSEGQEVEEAEEDGFDFSSIIASLE